MSRQPGSRPTGVGWWVGLLIVLACVAIVLVDALLWLLGGREATISRVVQSWGWSAHPLVMLSLGAVLGGTLVHLFGWRP